MSVYVGCWWCWFGNGTLLCCLGPWLAPWLIIVLKSCIIVSSCCRSRSLSSISVWTRCFSNSSHCCWIEVVILTFSSCCPVRTSLKLCTADWNLLGLWRVFLFLGLSVTKPIRYFKINYFVYFFVIWSPVLKYIYTVTYYCILWQQKYNKCTIGDICHSLAFSSSNIVTTKWLVQHRIIILNIIICETEYKLLIYKVGKNYPEATIMAKYLGTTHKYH